METMVHLMDTAIMLAGNQDSDENNIAQLGEGWVAEETLAIGIYCALWHENNFSEALIASVNHSGDSDSTGAVLGNILGAWVGYAAIEEKWKDGLELKPVIMEIGRDLAQRFLAAI